MVRQAWMSQASFLQGSLVACAILSLSLSIFLGSFTLFIEKQQAYTVCRFLTYWFFFFSLNKDTNFFFFFFRCALQLNLNLSRCLYICCLEEIKIVLLAHYSLIKRFRVQFSSTPKTDWYFGMMIKSKIIKVS